MRINNALRQYFTGRIDDRQLAAGTVSRIQTEHNFAFQRRLQQQVAQVVAEDIDRLGISGLCQLIAQLALDGRADETAVAVFVSGLQIRHGDAFRILHYLFRQIREDFIFIDQNGDLEDAGFFAAVHGQDAVRNERRNALGKLVVHFVYALFILICILGSADDLTVLAGVFADVFPISRLVADDFGDDFVGSGQNVLYGRKFHFLIFLIQEFLGLLLYGSVHWTAH